jgi:hypothetical protein
MQKYNLHAQKLCISLKKLPVTNYSRFREDPVLLKSGWIHTVEITTWFSWKSI